MIPKLNNETTLYLNFFNRLSKEFNDSIPNYQTKTKFKTNQTLNDILESAFPISSKDGMISLNYVDYDIRLYSSDGEPFGLSEIGREALLYCPTDLSEQLFNTYSEDSI